MRIDQQILIGVGGGEGGLGTIEHGLVVREEGGRRREEHEASAEIGWERGADPVDLSAPGVGAGGEEVG